MLRSLRKNAQSWMIKGVLWLVVAAFVGTIFLVWGRGGDVSETDMAAMVNDRVISMQQFYTEYQNLEQVYREVYGNLLENNIIDSDTLKREALENLINREILRETAEKLKIRVASEEIQSSISQTPAFSQNGQFNRERYLEILRQNGITPKDYEKQAELELKLKKLKDFIESSAKVSEKEIQDRYVTLRREVRVNYLSLDPKNMNVETPPAEEISLYYGENRERFRAPAKVSIEYARFTPEVFIRKAEVSEAEITTFHEANQERYLAPERRRFHEIVLPYRNDAEKNAALLKGREILGDIISGSITFQKGIEKFSLGNTKEAGESRVWYEKKDLPQSAADEAFTLAVDGVSTPFETGEEVKILKVAEIKRAEPYPLNEIREKVTEDLKAEKSRDMAIIKAYEARGRLVKGEKFHEVIPEYGISIRTTELISQADAEPELKTVIASSYLLAPGEVGEVKKVDDAHVLFRVLEKRESTVKRLEEVKKEIVSLLKEKKRYQKTLEKAEKIIAESKGEKGLREVGRKYNVEVKTTPYFSPIAPQGLPGFSLTRELIENIIALGNGNRIVEKPLDSEGKIYAFEFAGEKETSMINYDAERGQIASILFEQKKAAAMNAFIKEQRDMAKIEISDEFAR